MCAQKYTRIHTEKRSRMPLVRLLSCSQSCSQRGEKGRIRADDAFVQLLIRMRQTTGADTGEWPLDCFVNSRSSVQVRPSATALQSPILDDESRAFACLPRSLPRSSLVLFL